MKHSKKNQRHIEQLLAADRDVKLKLKEALLERDRLQKEIDELTSAIPELKSRQARGINAALACCGCGRGLKDDGGMTVYSVLQPLTAAEDHGILDISKLKELKGFVSTAEADEFAVTHGWQISDDKGPNHRCPECVKNESREGVRQRRGAYIDLTTRTVL